MTRRSCLAPLVIVLAALAPACAGGGTSTEKGTADPSSAPPQALSSVASSGPSSRQPGMDPAAFQDLMRRGAVAEKIDPPCAEGLYTETLAHPELTNEQRAMAQHRMGRLRLQQGRLDESRMYAEQAKALRPGWDEAKALLKQIDARAAKGGGATAKAADAPKSARKKKQKKDGDVAMSKGEKRAEKRAAASGKATAGGDAAAQKERNAELSAQLHQLEMERDLLRGRIKELESELVALRKDSEAKDAGELPKK